jgi:hypothetical protein
MCDIAVLCPTCALLQAEAEMADKAVSSAEAQLSRIQSQVQEATKVRGGTGCKK